MIILSHQLEQVHAFYPDSEYKHKQGNCGTYDNIQCVYTNDHGVNLWGHNNTLGLMMSSKTHHGILLYLGIGV